MKIVTDIVPTYPSDIKQLNLLKRLCKTNYAITFKQPLAVINASGNTTRNTKDTSKMSANVTITFKTQTEGIKLASTFKKLIANKHANLNVTFVMQK